jgi:hypothetical protein
MAHTPVNHPLRPLYRALAAVSGIYLILFGVVGLIVNAGGEFFAAHGHHALGQGANMFSAILSLALGAIVLLSTLIGRNVDTEADKFLGYAFLVIGSYGLATARTEANFLGFTVATIIVMYVIGLVLILASLYSKTAPPAETGAPRPVREGRVKEEVPS